MKRVTCASCAQEIWRPDWSVHPGETLKEVIEAREVTQREVAKICGVTESNISKIIRGSRGISAALAIRLEPATGVAAEFWSRLQAGYELDRARQRVKA